jgi:hypothetical protein
MKRLVLAITLASLAALPLGGAAAPRPRECPTVSVSCPDMISGGTPVTFTATVGGPAELTPTYKWAVSAGTITSGQGTGSITVDTAGVDNSLTATVEVGGLPESCQNSASCSASIFRCGLTKIDEYGNISFNDEKARLDNFAIELLNDPTAVGYLVGYGGRRSRRGEALKRLERAKHYLVTVRGVTSERLVTTDGGYREDLTVELHIRPQGAQPPMPVPTVDPNDVVFIEPAPRRRARRR